MKDLVKSAKKKKKESTKEKSENNVQGDVLIVAIDIDSST